MRDRLAELQQRAQDFSEATSENTNPFSEEGDDDDLAAVGVITPQAVVFEEEPIIENFLSETKKIRDDITALETEVGSVWHCFAFFFLTLIPPQMHFSYSSHPIIHNNNKKLASLLCLLPPRTGTRIRPAAEDPGGHHASLQRDEERQQHGAGHQAPG